jgi:hypothetical protein
MQSIQPIGAFTELDSMLFANLGDHRRKVLLIESIDASERRR